MLAVVVLELLDLVEAPRRSLNHESAINAYRPVVAIPASAVDRPDSHIIIVKPTNGTMENAHREVKWHVADEPLQQ